jgi:hypothetical protein
MRGHLAVRNDDGSIEGDLGGGGGGGRGRCIGRDLLNACPFDRALSRRIEIDAIDAPELVGNYVVEHCLDLHLDRARQPRHKLAPPRALDEVEINVLGIQHERVDIAHNARAWHDGDLVTVLL